MLQTVSTSSRDSEGSLTFFSAVSFHVENPEDFSRTAQDWKQALEGLRASAQDITIYQNGKLSSKQRESLLLFWQNAEEPAFFQETLKA
jgi:hypothetical protein